jgi:transposase
MTMLADQVDIVIGVDTHKYTHTGAVVMAKTGAALEDRTVPVGPDGYQELLELAERYSVLRAWAVEGTGSYGAGLTRFLTFRGERVIELDRPKRPARRAGAKSDPIDAVRAARDALGREQLGEPRGMGERAACSVLLAARRSAVEAGATAQRQLQALVVAAPEVLRAKFQRRSTHKMVSVASRLRVDPAWDLETAATARALRALARRALELSTEAKAHEEQLSVIVRNWRPDLLDETGVGPIVAAVLLCAWSHAGRCRSEGAFAMLGGQHRSRRRRG